MVRVCQPSGLARPGLHVQVFFAALVALLRVATATNLLKVGSFPDGSNCVDQEWGGSVAYIYSCHGALNQQWELTSEGLIRSLENQCFEVPGTGNNLLVMPCDASRPQKFFVSNGQIKPQGFRLTNGDWSMRVGWCVDASEPKGVLVLHGCHGGQNQRFSNPTFPKELEDLITVKGPWPNGKNCVDFDYSSDIAYVYACHGGANQRWSFTAKEELRTMGDKCMEYDGKSRDVFIRTCTGLAKQKWVVTNDGRVQPKGYQAADGSFVSMQSKCLDASLDNNKIYLYDCIADQANQKFVSEVLRPKSVDLLKIAGPWADGANCVDYNYDKRYANIYSCHGLANQMWELTADNQLRSQMNDQCLTFEEGEIGVYMSACSVTSGLQKWRATTDGEIHPMGFYRGSGEWRTGATSCLTAAIDTGVLALRDCQKLTNQKFLSRAIAVVRSHVYVSNGTVGKNCMAFDGTRVVIDSCVSVRSQVWEFTLANELRVDGKCLALNGPTDAITVIACDSSSSQQWRPTATGAIVSRQAPGKCLDWGVSSPSVSVAVCDATRVTQVFSSAVFQSVSGAIAGLFDKTSLLLDGVTADKFLTESVLMKAVAVVAEADKMLSSAVAADATVATTFLLQFLFQTAVLADYNVPVKVLYATARSNEFLLLTSVLIAAAKTKGKTLEIILPFATVFSDQVYSARREVLWDRVLTENPMLLELSVDGTLDDFDQLGGMLVPVCGLVAMDLKMCALGQYFQLMDQFVAFQYRLSVEGASAIRPATLAMGTVVVKLFSSSPLVKSDPLWMRVMSLLMFRAPYVGVLSDDVLARVTAPDLFLPAVVLYSLFGANNANTVPLESQIRFLSDQVTTYHFTNLLKMVESRDMESLDAYMTMPFSSLPFVSPINNYTTSDFPILVQFIAPIICDDLARAPLSLCQLEIFNDGLQSVLRFERQRRSNSVELEDVLEVDVRKKLDVIDQEKKQYEIMSTLMTVANQIGTTIKSEMASAKTMIAKSTAAIRKDVEAARVELRGAIGSVGQQIQKSLDESTAKLYNEIGQQSALIRQDIAHSSRQLAQRIDATGQAILGAVEQSRQELKYQIGAEAEKTRGFVAAKTAELKSHISTEVSGLREFVDAKTNQVIGVVREEGKSTRVFIDKKTSQIINVVRDESEKTRGVVRAESLAIQKHIDVKTNEVVAVVRQDAAETRGVVVQKFAELTTHVTSEANGIKAKVEELKTDVMNQQTSHYNNLYTMGVSTQGQIANSAATIKRDIRASTKALADIHTGSCVLSSTGEDDFQLARTKFLDTVKELDEQTPTLNGMLEKLGDTTTELLDELWPELILDAAVGAFTLGKGLLRRSPADIVSGVDRIGGAISDGLWLNGAENRVSAAGKSLKASFSNVKQYSLAMHTLVLQDAQKWDLFTVVVETGNNITEFAEKYKTFEIDGVRQVNFDDFAESMVNIIAVTCDALQLIKNSGSKFTSSEGAKAITTCFEATTLAGKVGARMTDSLTYVDQMRAALTKTATARLECNKAQDAMAWAASNSGRRLRRQLAQRVDIPDNEPYYMMTYTALSKIILDYQLQEAAFQFCKFYEFRNGGVPPAVCGSSSATTRTYYTLSQILQMRAYNPPMYNSVGMRAHLPTKPIFTTVYNRTYGPANPIFTTVYNRTYPYVDLARLRAGKPVYFKLPTWDIDWLKQHGWISPTVAASKVPSTYLESIIIYLPVQGNTSSGDPTTSSIAVAVNVESTPRQSIGLTKRDHHYVLPPQTFTSGATYGAAGCHPTNYRTNPYDVAAGCVQDDATSDVCLREKGTTQVLNQKQIFPGLFSTWRLTADFSEPPGGVLDVMVPKDRVDSNMTSPNATTVGDLLLIVDLTVIQVTTAQSSAASVSTVEEVAATPTADSTCCAADEFRVAKNKCKKCLPGTIGALHGYACVPV